MTFTKSIKTCFSKYVTFAGRAPFGISVLYVVLPPWKYHLVFVRWFRPRDELHTAGELSVRLGDVFTLNMCNHPLAA